MPRRAEGETSEPRRWKQRKGVRIGHTARAHAEAVLVRDAWNMNGMTHIDGSYGSYLHPSVDMTHAWVVLCRVGFGLGTYDIGSDRTASSIFLISYTLSVNCTRRPPVPRNTAQSCFPRVSASRRGLRPGQYVQSAATLRAATGGDGTTSLITYQAAPGAVLISFRQSVPIRNPLHEG